MVKLRNLEIAVNQGIDSSAMIALFDGLPRYDEIFGNYRFTFSSARIEPNIENAVVYDFEEKNELSQRIRNDVNGSMKLFVINDPLMIVIGNEYLAATSEVIGSYDDKDFAMVSAYSINEVNIVKLLARGILKMELESNKNRLGGIYEPVLYEGCRAKDCIIYQNKLPYGFYAKGLKEEFNTREYFREFNFMLERKENLCKKHRDALDSMHAKNRLTHFSKEAINAGNRLDNLFHYLRAQSDSHSV